MEAALARFDIRTTEHGSRARCSAGTCQVVKSSSSLYTLRRVWLRNSETVHTLQILDARLSSSRVRVPSKKECHSSLKVSMCASNTATPAATFVEIPISIDSSVAPLPPPKRHVHSRILEDELAHFFGIGKEGTSADDEVLGGLIEDMRAKLTSMDDGETLPSIYDTAWVARVPAVDGSGGPQFPRTVQWILENQLVDGSWGEESYFLAYDRIINTLACVIALKTWDTGHDSVQRGVDFISTNTRRLENEADAHMLSGFEVAFTAMLEEAKRLGLELPYESPFVKKVAEARERKLKRIPVDVLHTHATTLLYSLEGLASLVDWERIMQLQSKDGSFLSSPASTACVLMHTGDRKCLEFLTNTLSSFNNEAVPCHYPIDLFERLWLVDTIERLGISRLFYKEIKEVLEYVHSYWTPRGIGWARDLPVQDIDDTAMAFRLLRMYGFDVSADVFEHFRQDGKFFCFAREMRHGVSEMLNLYRASQVRFPGEKVLEEAYLYSKAYLESALKNEDAFDKWSLKKDLPGEVAHALKYPWHKSLPRFDSRIYMDHYGTDDIWLAKTIYLLPSVNNKKLNALSKIYFNGCQAVQQREIQQLIRWWQDIGFAYLPLLRQRPVETYFSPAAALFEPDFSAARSVFAKASILADALNDVTDRNARSLNALQVFSEAVRRWDPTLVSCLPKTERIIFKALYETVNEWVESASKLQGRDMEAYIRESWVNLVAGQVKEAQWATSNYTPSLADYQENGIYSTTQATVARNTILFCGDVLTDEMLAKLDTRSSILRSMCLSSLLVRDIYKVKTCSSQRATAVKCYMKDHPGVTEEEAVEHLTKLNDQTLVALTHEFLRPDAEAPMSCKRVIFCLSRSAQFFNTNRPKDLGESLQKVLEKLLIEPVM